MADGTKEILAELGLFGISLPRNLHIPKLTAPPATDLLNIQFTVMDMLVDDPQIAPVVANCWNLGMEIRAFNVQNQIWDILELDDNIELPARASIQVIFRNNEPVEDQGILDPEPIFVSKRDPRRKHMTPLPESKAVSKRDPRRKYRDPPERSDKVDRFLETEKAEPSKPFVPSKRDPRKRSQAVVAQLEVAKSGNVVQEPAKPPPIVINEPNIRNLSKNDPRRKRLLEKSKAHSSILSSNFINSTEPVKNVGKEKTSNNDSDSDEGNLQIDESFDEKSSKDTPVVSSICPVKRTSEPARINENQLADSSDMLGRKSDCKGGIDDVGLWDEIYGVTTETNGSLNIYDPSSAVKSKNVKQMAKSIGLKTLNDKITGLSQNSTSSSKEILNISDEADFITFKGQETIKGSGVGPSIVSGLAIDLTESSDEKEIIKTESKTVEQLEIERELLMNLVKERDRMNEIVAGIPLPDEIIIDKEIEEGELSDTPNNSDNENTLSGKGDLFSPESPKGLQIDMDTEESEIDIIPLEREEVLLKHKKNMSKSKPSLKSVPDDDSDIEEIPLEASITTDIKALQVEDSDKYKKYWDDFPEEVQDKSTIPLDRDFKSGLKKLSDIKSNEKASKTSNCALKSVKKTFTASKSDESAPSQNFWKGTSAQLSSYSEKIRQKVHERRNGSTKKSDIDSTENLIFQQNETTDDKTETTDIPLPLNGPTPVRPIRKSGGLLEFPPPVKVLANPPQPLHQSSSFPKSSISSADRTNLPPPPVPGVFNSSIPPPVATFGFPPPSKPSFPAPPPLLLPSFPAPNTAFPPPPLASSFTTLNSDLPGSDNNRAPPKAPNKVPSLLEMNIPKPANLDTDNKQSAWLDPMLPQGRQGTKAGSSGTRKDMQYEDRGRHSKERTSHEREGRKKRSRSRDRRSEDRSRKSGERDVRSSERDRRRRRSRSRSRDRRRSRNERRVSQDSSSSQDSGIRRERDRTSQEKISRPAKRESESEKNKVVANGQKGEIKNNSMEVNTRDEDRDNVMLCFYEGEDCMDDPGDPDELVQMADNSNEKKGDDAAETPQKPPPAFGIASCLSSLIESRESKQLFPEPVPAISATADTSSATPAPPAPPSISGNAPPTRGEIITASLGLADKHPVSAVYEYSNRMKFKKPWFEERWGPGGGWAYAVTIGPNTYSSPWFKPKKRDAKMEACRYALQQLGIFNKISS